MLPPSSPLGVPPAAMEQEPDRSSRNIQRNTMEEPNEETAMEDVSQQIYAEMEYATDHEDHEDGEEEEVGFVRKYYPLPVDTVEDIEMYQPGGYHPTHLNDVLCGFKIIHKLGCGGYSTVWLAQDIEKQRYVAVKINTADASSEEKKDHGILEYVFEKGRDHPVLNFIDRPIQTFHIEGPNGKHLCIVSNLLGPSIAQLTSAGSPLDAQEARRAASQLTRCIEFLHSGEVGIVHGDLSPSNVLLEISGIDQWSVEKIYDTFGELSVVELLDVSGEPNTSPSGPRYVVEPANIMEIFSLNTGNIKLIDIGEAFHVTSPPEDGVGTPAQFCSPELLVHHTASKASDIWALGCTIFEMRIGQGLIEGGIGYDWEFLNQMAQLFGPVPRTIRDGESGDQGEVWTLWHRVMGEEPLDEPVPEEVTDGDTSHLLPIHENPGIERRRANYFARLKIWFWDFCNRWWTTIVEHIRYGRGRIEEQKEDQPEKRELKALFDLLSGVFNYEVGKRLTAGQMLLYPWLSANKDL